MGMSLTKLALPLLCTVVMFLAVATGRAHEGHDHGAPPPPTSSTIAPRADASSSDLELVIIARGEKLEIYLDTFRGNEPIDGAEIEVDGPGGILKPIAAGAGFYTVVAPFAAKPGIYDLAITISANGVVDVLTTTLKVSPSTQPQAVATPGQSWGIDPAFAQEFSQRFGQPGTSFLVSLGLGFIAGVGVTALVLGRRRAAAGLILMALLPVATPTDVLADAAPTGTTTGTVARDISQRFPDGALFVPKPTQRILGLRTLFTEQRAHRQAIELPGRVIPDPNASGFVQAAVGGRLLPPPGGFKPLGTAVKTGDILAYVHPPISSADLTTQQQQARELDQQISVVSRKVERLRAIEKIIARGQLEDAELELKGLHERRTNLARANKEPEPLVAPVSGVIAASNAVAGQMAEPNSIIFQIIDPARLWVEALSFEPQSANGSAQGLFAGGKSIELAYVGTGLADRNQSVPVHFSIRGDARGLRAGQFLTVLATTTADRTGIAVPREAVLRGANGQSIVYEHSNAERFVPREVRIEQLDAERVLIVAGIEPGKRVVTTGAELLNQIR
ncbi:MAG: efflux RND transporter periplasmic adaptor subunit [Hyphomicrobiaceae bacterium]|nr:efflux RND transporter periplasmic adaptor subunit [Hyphomicrobiaceae bacterium]